MIGIAGTALLPYLLRRRRQACTGRQPMRSSSFNKASLPTGDGTHVTTWVRRCATLAGALVPSVQERVTRSGCSQLGNGAQMIYLPPWVVQAAAMVFRRTLATLHVRGAPERGSGGMAKAPTRVTGSVVQPLADQEMVRYPPIAKASRMPDSEL